MKISVLIPTWKRPHKLKKCLDAILNQQLKPYEVLVSYRDDDLETVDLLSQLKTTHSFTPILVKESGVIYAENEMLKYAKGDIVAFIDDDGYAPINWLSRIDEYFSNDSELVGIGGPDAIVGGEHERFDKNIFGKVTWYGKTIGNHHHRGMGVHRVDVLKGVNMAFLRNKMPFLDEKLQSEQYEGNGCHWELDVCLTLGRESKLLFDTSLELDHESDHSEIKKLVNIRNNARNYTYIYFKHFGFMRRISYLLYCLFIGNSGQFGILKLLQLIIQNKNLSEIDSLSYSWQGVKQGISLYRSGK